MRKINTRKINARNCGTHINETKREKPKKKRGAQSADEIKRNHTNVLNYKYFDKIFKEYLHGVLTISASLHHESLNDSFAQLNVLLTIHQNTVDADNSGMNAYSVRGRKRERDAAEPMAVSSIKYFSERAHKRKLR